jgi:hypothetical protein
MCDLTVFILCCSNLEYKKFKDETNQACFLKPSLETRNYIMLVHGLMIYSQTCVCLDLIISSFKLENNSLD